MQKPNRADTAGDQDALGIGARLVGKPADTVIRVPPIVGGSTAKDRE
jgi:hypothetical protein